MRQLVIPLLFAASIPQAHAAGMLGYPERKLTVDYVNGDKIAVVCPDHDPCGLEFRVAGKTFAYASSELGDIVLVPRSAVLYSARSKDAKERYFTFIVSAACREDDPEDNRDCYASGSVTEGQPVRVKLIHAPANEIWPY
ncbi:hypothetical protein ACFPOA_15820 [Lysobacter niabensis]|uniref:hypothetical protein n=1 Tax=Agrilutibacter niabensis TaxID=380628 RepID=UPI003612862C